MLTKERIVEILKGIKDPETELSVHDLGVVKSIDYEPARRTLIICLDVHRRTPSCHACQPIAWMLQHRIEDDLRRTFQGSKRSRTSSSGTGERNAAPRG